MTTTYAPTPIPADNASGSRLRAFVRGRSEDSAWVRPTLLGLLAMTAALYVVGLSASGWANEFYTAAAQAGGESWKAWLFGSLDSANFITVDKPPASLWLMGLSVRIFGLSSWSILVPQALAGVATVGLLYLGVRRWFGPLAGLLAGAVLALTPVATLIFRFNNPDALLVLLLVAAAYAMTRAVEDGRTQWVVLAGSLVGLAFLTKMLQAFLVLPGFTAAYLVAAPVPFLVRLRRLFLGGLALVASAGWWIAVVELWPASSRPYIGGSQENSILELTLGYNGLGRITGDETGSVGGNPGGGGGGWGQTGWNRLLDSEIGSQIGWLLPASVLALAVLLWTSSRGPRTDRARAFALLWGGWLLVTAAVFSFMQGIFHAYYTVALAPAIGALVAVAGVTLWQRRDSLAHRVALALVVGVAAWWGWVLLGRTPDWYPWLRALVLVSGVVAVSAILALPRLQALASQRGAVGGLRLGAAVLGLSVLATLAGPAAYSVATAAEPHTGAIPSAGPAGAVGAGFGGRGMPGGQGGPGQQALPNGQGQQALPNGQGQQAVPDGQGQQAVPDGQGQQGFPGGGQGMAGGGGLAGGIDVDTELVALLQDGADGYTWAAAAVGSTSAAPLQIASEEAVMALGGFNGTDPAPTLAEFQDLVAEGAVHYFVSGGGGFGGSDETSQIAAWVEENFTAQTVGSYTVYDLSQNSGGGNGTTDTVST